MVRVVAIAALVTAVVPLAVEAAMACSCAYVPPKQQLAESDGAATARLLDVRRLDGAPGTANFIYRAGRVIKGRARGLRRGRRLVVRSAYESASCGLANRVGRLTGLFLTRSHGRWTSNSCNEIAAGEMRRLGAGAGTRGALERCTSGG